jgi:hypothetical protein
MLELERLVVLTLARAHECGIAAHARASYVCALHREGAPPLHVSFLSFPRILEFITEMNPTSASVEGGRGEDISALSEAVSEAMEGESVPAPPSVTLH